MKFKSVQMQLERFCEWYIHEYWIDIDLLLVFIAYALLLSFKCASEDKGNGIQTEAVTFLCKAFYSNALKRNNTKIERHSFTLMWSYVDAVWALHFRVWNLVQCSLMIILSILGKSLWNPLRTSNQFANLSASGSVRAVLIFNVNIQRFSFWTKKVIWNRCTF